MSPKVIDLFAGAGGFSLGFEQEGFDIILANEYNPVIASAYKENHKVEEVITGDIRALSLGDVFGRFRNTIDVIIGGPPCQGFSQKGKRNTVGDERNFLFQYYAKAVELVNPRYFVMENVPNILTAEDGYFAKEIEKMFCTAGYQLRMGVLNAADFGVPQNRRRAFVIGKKGGPALDFPNPVSCKVTVWDAVSDLAYLESGEGEEEQAYRFDVQSDYQKMLRNGSVVLYNHKATRHSKTALERMAMIPPNAGKEVLPKEHLTKSVFSGTWTRMAKDEVSVTITTRFDTPSSGRFMHPFLNRAITVREAARIQSFPDTFRFMGSKGIQMKQAGNAVPPLLARAIAETILDDLKKN